MQRAHCPPLTSSATTGASAPSVTRKEAAPLRASARLPSSVTASTCRVVGEDNNSQQ